MENCAEEEGLAVRAPVRYELCSVCVCERARSRGLSVFQMVNQNIAMEMKNYENCVNIQMLNARAQTSFDVECIN